MSRPPLHIVTDHDLKATAPAVTETVAQRVRRLQAEARQLAHEAEEQRPIETLWDVTVGATAYAKSIPYQDERVAVERKAGAIMDLAA